MNNGTSLLKTSRDFYKDLRMGIFPVFLNNRFERISFTHIPEVSTQKSLFTDQYLPDDIFVISTPY